MILVKKIRIIFVCLMVIMTLIIMITAVLSKKEMEREWELEQVRQQVDGQIKKNMENAVKAGNFSHYLEPSEVSFSVTDVHREDDLRYVVKIIFVAETNRKLSDMQMKEAAGDMEKLFKEFQTSWGRSVTVCAGRENGGIVSIINGKVICMERKRLQSLKIKRQKCIRVILL